jgi:hypoxanthine phosphoribosyltransferase
MRLSPPDGDALTLLFAEDQIRAKVAELAARINHDYAGEEVLLVGVLKGSFHFLSDLSRCLGTNFIVDFVQVSSYGTNASSTGVVQIRKDLDINVEGKHVLIVEDIVDTGLTLQHLRELLRTRRPRSLKVVSLFSKPEAHQRAELTEYVGFEIPNKFVVGYGLDYAERYRNLPYVAFLDLDPTP